MIEEWRDIPSYEGKYQVSNLGNVRALNYHRQKITKLIIAHKDKNGYLRVGLYRNGKIKNYQVHRLVMSAFVEKSNLTVNHKDEDKQNNKLDNLEYMTNKENVRYSQAFEIVGVNIETGEKIYFNSTRDVKNYGFSQRCVRRVLAGEYKQTKGYTFYYKN